MQHASIINFHTLWTEKCPKGNSEKKFPDIDDFSATDLALFDERDCILSQKDGGFYFEQFGERLQYVTSQNLKTDEVFDIYPSVTQNIMRDMLRFCFQHQAGLNRVSRFWVSHRHVDVEWILLPAYDRAGELVMIGGSVSFADHHERDLLVANSEDIERILVQNYLSVGGKLSLQQLSIEARSYLAVMGTKLAIDNKEVTIRGEKALGGAAAIAAKVARPSVLIVSDVQPFVPYITRLASRYNLKMVETLHEASEILALDAIDVLVVSEQLPNAQSGLDLLEKAMAHLAHTGLVVLLEDRHQKDDDVIEVGGQSIPYLTKPVGEFALRQAVELAAKTRKTKY